MEYHKTLEVGEQLKYLKVLDILPGKNGKPKMAVCLCECGNIKEATYTNVRLRQVNSCGCKTKEMLGKSNYKHGQSNTTEHDIWKGILDRCYNSKSKSYPYYGGRGIEVSYSWKRSFLCFIEDMGPRPSEKFSVERIDNNKNYCKENCKWDTKENQMRNRRPSKHTRHFRGVRLCKNGNFMSRIRFENKEISLGTYTSLEDAIDARLQGEALFWNIYAT